MLESSPSSTDSHLVIYLTGCLALTVIRFGSGSDKPLSNILSLTNSWPAQGAHLKNGPLITSQRNTLGVCNSEVHGGNWFPLLQRQVLLSLFLCFTNCLSVCPVAAAFYAAMWAQESKSKAACFPVFELSKLLHFNYFWTFCLLQKIGVSKRNNWFNVSGKLNLNKKLYHVLFPIITYIFYYSHLLSIFGYPASEVFLSVEGHSTVIQLQGPQQLNKEEGL